jgi:hypothetical protein
VGGDFCGGFPHTLFYNSFQSRKVGGDFCRGFPHTHFTTHFRAVKWVGISVGLPHALFYNFCRNAIAMDSYE